jgi:hypothetical protein
MTVNKLIFMLICKFTNRGLNNMTTRTVNKPRTKIQKKPVAKKPVAKKPTPKK